MMIRSIILFLILLYSGSLVGQSIKKKSFDLMLEQTLSHTVEEIDVESAASRKGAIWLDAREQTEYSTSKIKDAIWVGYDDFKMKRVADLDKNEEIIVYCSIGYRSEKIAEKLEKKGFRNVKNLYGGIFSWVNQDKEVYDSAGSKTEKVHAFSKVWGVWLDKGEKVY